MFVVLFYLFLVLYVSGRYCLDNIVYTLGKFSLTMLILYYFSLYFS
jgi:hypothetical protein